MNTKASRALLRPFHAFSLVLAVVLCAPLSGEEEAATKAETRWDLTPIYPSDAAWRKALDELSATKGSLDPLKGKLEESPANLEKALDAAFDLRQRAVRLGSYANMRGDEDTREAGPQGMRQMLQAVTAELSADTSWVEPELLSIPREKLSSWVEKTPGLREYGRYLERLDKRREHVLDAESERILGMARLVQGDGIFIGNILRNAEIPWKTIELPDGSSLRVDVQGYSRGRADEARELRQRTYKAFYETLSQFKGTLAATVAASVKEHVFNARVRRYDSPLEASLAAAEVDTAVYRMLVEEINAALPSLHRYLKLRGRMLGIDDLRYHDMYPALVGDVEAVYDWDASRQITTLAVAPLGEEYARRLETALRGGWVDVYPREGKRSGAYVDDGAYGVHPYMLLNHQDDYETLSTLAHEAGHLMHSWYSQEAQPYPTSSYATFVAEVASTVNEVLLFHHMLENVSGDDELLVLLGNFLENFRQTVFRQTMFAEFELAIHDAAQKGEPLTAEVLDALYGGLLERYHGHDRGIVQIDDLYAVEWAFVPHFHYNFYVYQYATSYVAAIALAERIHDGVPGATERYLSFLKGGSSKPPVELLQDAGVDMTTPAPIRSAMRVMSDVMDRIEAIVARRK